MRLVSSVELDTFSDNVRGHFHWFDNWQGKQEIAQIPSTFIIFTSKVRGLQCGVPEAGSKAPS